MFNNYPTITLVFNRRKKASSTVKASIEIRILYNYKQKYISTGIRVLKSQWNKGKIVNHPQSLQLNKIINTQVAQVQEMIFKQAQEGIIKLETLNVSSPESTSENFIDFCKQRAEVRKYEKAKDTQERYDRFIRLFSAWGIIQNFSDITDNNIILYDKYLISKGLKTYSKWNNYHRFLNSFIMDAIEDGHLKRNPYKWINIQRGKESKRIERCLTPYEFRLLKNSFMHTSSLERVRDLFLFQTYTCLSYSDLKDFSIHNIQNFKGIKVYTNIRKKTGKSFIVPLLPPALSILNKYNNKLPIISNVKYNEYLKVVALAAGIDKPLSSHWARHTGATLLLNEGISMQIISKICGHSSTKITEQVYAKLLDETVIEAIKGIKI